MVGHQFPHEGKWIASTDPESWSPVAEYDTEQEAIENAPADLGLPTGDSFFVGQVALANVLTYRYFNVASFLEDAKDVVSDNIGGPCGDRFLDKTTSAMRAELETELHQTFVAWMNRHHLVPNFFNVDGVGEVHVVPEVTATGRVP